jgi:hypothetical protein
LLTGRATTCFGRQSVSVRLNTYTTPANVSHSRPFDYIVIMEIVGKVVEVAYMIKIHSPKLKQLVEQK